MNNAEDRGWWDRKDGRLLLDNPYEPGSISAKDWAKGWEQAKQQGHGARGLYE